jgi:hypothetical protein
MKKPKKKRNILIGCGTIVVLLVVAAACCSMINSISSNKQSAYTSPTKTIIPPSINSSNPINTLGSRSTPGPTNTPQPTALPTATMWPNLISCSDLYAKHESSTDLQWQELKGEMVGENIYFSGSVGQVYEGNWASLSNSDDGCGININKIPHNIAVKLQKGQYVEGYGTIKDFSWFLGMVDIEINVIPDELIVH